MKYEYIKSFNTMPEDFISNFLLNLKRKLEIASIYVITFKNRVD